MKKCLLKAAAILLAAGLLTGCGSKTSPSFNDLDVEQYVTLGDYYNLGLTLEIESQIKQLMQKLYHSGMPAEDGITNRPVEPGDGVDIDYEGKKDGVAFAGGTAQGTLLSIGSGQFIAGFEDGLVGVMPGETVDLNLTFPEYYRNTELAGQAVVFTVTVNYIMPEEQDMKDSVIESLDMEGISTVAALREDVFDYLFYYSSEMELARNDVMMALLDICTFAEELPQDFVDDARKMFKTDLERQAAYYGMTAEEAAQAFGAMSEEEFLKTQAEQNVRKNLAMQAVANKEGLSVSDEKLQELLELSVSSGEFNSVEEFLEYYNYTREQYRNLVMEDNVTRFLLHLQDTI